MRYILAFAFLFTLILPAAAQTTNSFSTMPEVKQVEDYLNTLTTLKARFVQTAPNGNQLQGDFWMKRPGRLRFQYDKPVEDFIVADGQFIYYYDSELKEQKNTLISQSLADFFLRKDLTLNGKVKVMDVKRDSGLLMITVTQSKDPLAGTLTMGFSETPMTLKKWRVVDAQGLITETELFDVVTGGKIDSELFHYYDPKRGEGKLN